MVHNEEEDSLNNFTTLEKLYQSLEIHHGKKKSFRLSIFEYFNMILTRSRIPPQLDFICWVIFFLIIEGIITLTALSDNFFVLLSPTFSGTEEIQSANFLYSKLTTQLFSVILFAITLFFIILQKPLPFFNTNPKMGHARANILYFSFVYLPILLTPIHGILFGCHILSAYSEANIGNSARYYALLVAISFVFLMGSTAIFTSITKLKLTVSSNPFEFWGYPYNYIDILFFFLIGIFFPIRSAPFKKATIGMMIVQLIFGIYLILKRKTPAFLFLCPLFLEIKLAIDFIFFSICSIVNLVLENNSYNRHEIACIIHFISFVLAIFIFSKIKIFVSTTIRNKKVILQHRIITTPSMSIATLRYGMSLSIPMAFDLHLIKWIAQWRYSNNLLPDLFRTCLVAKIPLKDILIPKTSIGPHNLVSFQFLVFQVNIFFKMIQENSSSQIETFNQLNKDLEKIELILSNFWTTNDYDQTTIYKLGCHINKVKSDFEKALMEFPLSDEIQKLYKYIMTDILRTPWLIKEDSKNPYYSFAFPSNTIFKSISQKSTKMPDMNIQFRPTSNEKIAMKSIKKGILPLKIYFEIIVALIFIFSLGLCGLYYIHIGINWDYYSQIIKYHQANVGIATKTLIPTDHLMSFPDASTIQLIIGVPIEVAAAFRIPMSYENPFSDSISQVAKYIPDYIEIQNNTFYDMGDPNYVTIHTGIRDDGIEYITYPECVKMSYSSASSFDWNHETDISHRKCVLMNLLYYMRGIEYCYEDLQLEFNNYISHFQFTERLVILALIIILIIIFIQIFLLMRRRHSKILGTMRVVMSGKPHFYENEYLDFQFWFLPNLIFFVIFIICIAGLFISFLVPINDNNYFISSIINDTVYVATIARSMQNAITLAEFSIKNPENRKDYENLYREQCVDVYSAVNMLTVKSVSSIFSRIQPLDIWSLPIRDSYNTYLLDMCRLLLEGNHSEESFDFLAARAFYISNATMLITYTLPEMITTAHYSMQAESTNFWWITIFLALVAFLACLVYNSFLYKRQKTWFRAALIILLRSDGDLKTLLKTKNACLVDLVPFPIIIKNKKGIIMYANQAISPYTNLTLNQLIGQPIKDVWEITRDNHMIFSDKTVVLTEKRIDKKLSMVTLNDITEINKTESKYKSLIKQMKITNLKLPTEIEMYVIEMRLKAEEFDIDFIFDLYDNAEKECQNLIRISCGPSFYSAILPVEYRFSQIVSFLNKISSLSEEKISNFKISIVHSIGKIINLCEKNTIPLLCGNAATRVHDCVLHGSWGRIYIDYDLIKKVKSKTLSSFKKYVIEISDVKLQPYISK